MVLDIKLIHETLKWMESLEDPVEKLFAVSGFFLGIFSPDITERAESPEDYGISPSPLVFFRIAKRDGPPLYSHLPWEDLFHNKI